MYQFNYNNLALYSSSHLSKYKKYLKYHLAKGYINITIFNNNYIKLSDRVIRAFLNIDFNNMLSSKQYQINIGMTSQYEFYIDNNPLSFLVRNLKIRWYKEPRYTVDIHINDIITELDILLLEALSTSTPNSNNELVINTLKDYFNKEGYPILTIEDHVTPSANNFITFDYTKFIFKLNNILSEMSMIMNNNVFVDTENSIIHNILIDDITPFSIYNILYKICVEKNMVKSVKMLNDGTIKKGTSIILTNTTNIKFMEICIDTESNKFITHFNMCDLNPDFSITINTKENSFSKVDNHYHINHYILNLFSETTDIPFKDNLCLD